MSRHESLEITHSRVSDDEHVEILGYCTKRWARYFAAWLAIGMTISAVLWILTHLKQFDALVHLAGARVSRFCAKLFPD